MQVVHRKVGGKIVFGIVGHTLVLQALVYEVIDQIKQSSKEWNGDDQAYKAKQRSHRANGNNNAQWCHARIVSENSRADDVVVYLVDQEHDQRKGNDQSRIGKEQDHKCGNKADEKAYGGNDIPNGDRRGDEERVRNLENGNGNVGHNANYQGVKQTTLHKFAKQIVCRGADFCNALVYLVTEYCAAEFHNLQVALFLGREQIDGNENCKNDVGRTR